MRLVEEQRQQRLLGIAALGQLLEQFRQQPEQEGGVDLGRLVDQAAGVEQVDAPAAVRRRLQQVLQLQRRFAEQRLRALLLEGGQLAQQGLGRLRREQRAVLAEHLGMRLQVVEQGLEVLEIEQQQAIAVGHLEGGVQRGLLAVGQLQQGAEQQRAHFAEGGAQRVAALSGHVPQGHRVGLRPVREPGHAGDALGDLALRLAGGAEAAQIALDVGGEHRHAGIAEQLGEALQGDGLAGAGGAGDQPVAVGQAQQVADGLPGRIGAEQQLTILRHLPFPRWYGGHDPPSPSGDRPRLPVVVHSFGWPFSCWANSLTARRTS
ncbi:hypothetical protein D3C85_934800 [compost metagenome]